MYITITSIQLRSVWQFFKLSNHGRKIQQQTKSAEGFVRMKNSGWGKMHYTMSVWETEAAIKQFARSGQHLEAMKHSKELSQEIRIYTFEATAIPAWKGAKQLLAENGRVLKFS